MKTLLRAEQWVIYCRPDYQNHENQAAGFGCRFSAKTIQLINGWHLLSMTESLS